MRFAFIIAIALLVTASSWSQGDGRARQELSGVDSSGIRIVHGIADAGPLDVYVDGAIALIGIVFGETSGDLRLQDGEHDFAVVPTGESAEGAIAAGTIDLRAETRYYASLLGTSDAASVGLFEIDDRPLDPGVARFRVVGGVIDAGALVPVFAGGDALSEPLAFGDASEYAAIDAGVYDLDMLDVASGALILALPQTALTEGTTTDIILVGQISAGTLQALVMPVSVEVARASGRSAQIQTGTCAEPGAMVADLGVVQAGQSETVGLPGTTAVAQGYGLALLPFSLLLDSAHTVTVSEGDASGADIIACGEIGGALTDTGALAIAMISSESALPGGIAVLAAALEDPETTGVSIFVVSGAEPATAAATPEPATE